MRSFEKNRCPTLLDSGWPNSSKLFLPDHPRSRILISAVALWSVALQHFMSFSSMQGSSLRGYGEKGARRTHTCKKLLKYNNRTGGLGLYTHSQFNFIAKIFAGYF